MALPPVGPQKTFLNACLKLCRRAAGASTMLPSLVVSALFVLLTLVLAHGARRLADRYIKDPFVRLLLQEAIAAAELCGCCFELIIGTRRCLTATVFATAVVTYLRQELPSPYNTVQVTNTCVIHYAPPLRARKP